jgi:hypothetical protein
MQKVGNILPEILLLVYTYVNIHVGATVDEIIFYGKILPAFLFCFYSVYYDRRDWYYSSNSI